ncbi:MAG: cytochrome B5 [Geobacteraceae bacterium GWC2_53_11]|nr:MAG: cytochrome B5 [Geobacteraceae bacterium GWC2_53_11]
MTGLFFLLLSTLCSPHPACATEEYARQTGQACSACHLDPAGGGELTARGTAFSATLHSTATAPSSPGMFAKIVRLVVGYIHFFTAIFWFGTILYVHLVLKPSYAASGLPRGEVRVGIISMAVMGITGVILTHYRVSSLDTLIHTRFGILLIIKVSLYLIMVSSAAFVVTVIGPKLRAKMNKPALPPASGDLTPEQLAACDGKEGRPAYFAFEGKIYDATLSKFWKQGVHMGRHNAGTNLTEAMTQAPHGADKIALMKEIGVLITEGPRKKELHERVFYFMAYMNLIIVFCIVLILSLWRWG